MDDALAMRPVERVGDLGGDLQRLVERKRSLHEPRGQRLALEMRHDQVVRAIDVADVVDAADVRMIERGNRPRLAFETCTQIGIAGDFSWQDLDGDCAIEARVAGFVDLAHAARAERAEDFVRTESGAGGKCHACPPRLDSVTGEDGGSRVQDPPYIRCYRLPATSYRLPATG